MQQIVDAIDDLAELQAAAPAIGHAQLDQHRDLRDHRSAQAKEHAVA